VPQLSRLLYDSNLRVRIKAVIALGQLGDAAAVSALEEMAAHDPHGYGKDGAKAALARIKQGTPSRQ
jgi:HEAT repeat protein